MYDIDATPRRPPNAQPIKSPLLNDIDATPRRIPGPREIKSAPMDDRDATPRHPPRLEKEVEQRPINRSKPSARIVPDPHIVGPGRTNKAIVPLSNLPALEALTPLPRLEKKTTSYPISSEARRNLASQTVK